MSSPPTASADPSRPQASESHMDDDAEMQDVAPETVSSNAGAGAGTATATATAHERLSTVEGEGDSSGPVHAHADINTNSASDPTTQQQPQHSTQTQTQNSSIPAHQQQSRKDVTLREFLSKMDDYAPIIPDAVTAHYLTLAGLPPPSPHDPSGASTGTTPLPLARLLALATQKFVADIAADAYQYSRIRASNTSAASNPLGTGMPLAPGMPGQAGMVAGAGGGGVAGVGAGVGGVGGKAGQNAQLGVQRAGFGGGGQGGGGGKTVLTMEDLGMAVQDYGVNVRRGEFYR